MNTSGSTNETTLEDELFDYATANPEGFTNEDFMAARDVSLERFKTAAKNLRKTFEDDTINLVCDPAGDGGRWIYRLVGTFKEAKPWIKNRLDDTESRLVTINSVATSSVNGSDGRTLEGRRARLIEKTTRRLIEDLVELKDHESSQS